MFRRTRFSLAFWNTVVVAVILALFSGAIYVDVRARLISTVDHQVTQQVRQMTAHLRRGQTPPPIIGEGAGGQAPGQTGSPLQRAPLGVLLWSEDGQSLTQAPPAYLTAHDIVLLRRIEQSGRSQTVMLGGEAVRAVVIPPLPNSVGPARQTSGLMGLRNIADVTQTLTQLRILTTIGALIGIVIAIFVGLLLAQRALVPIRKSWERQVQFVADASHELRTPLTSIASNAEFLLSGSEKLPDKQANAIHSIFRSSRHLGRLLEHLLTLARSDADTIQLSLERTDLVALTQDVAEQFTPLCEAEGISLIVQTPGAVTADIDSTRIRQALFNLLDNARKANSAGGRITLSVTANRRVAVWSVADNGIGIPNSDLPRIFDRFYQVGANKTAAGTPRKGSGLGLSIVKWVVEAHGGTIHADSALGEGSTFTMTIPLRDRPPLH